VKSKVDIPKIEL